MSYKDNVRYVSIYCDIVDETEFAIRIFDGATYAWLPKQHVANLNRIEEMRDVEVKIPEWLAKERGLI